MEQNALRRDDRPVPTPLRVRARRVLAVLLAGAVLAVSGAVPAASAASRTSEPHGTTSDPASVRWTVKPADSEGPDGRKRITTSTDPGSTVEEHLAVKNLSDGEATFALSAADGRFNQNGRFDMLPADEQSVDAGTWIELPETVTVPAWSTAVVPFTIAVPDAATPGDHVAGVAASIVSDAGRLQVVSRVGFRVTVDVRGEVAPGPQLTVTGVQYRTSWNPFRPGALEIRYVWANTGNVRLDGSGTATTSGLFGMLHTSSEVQVGEVSPSQERQGSVVVEGVWPGVRDMAVLTVSPHTLGDRGSAPLPALERRAGFWAVPWSQLGLVLSAALAVMCAIRLVAWRRRRFASRLDELVKARLGLDSVAATAEPASIAEQSAEMSNHPRNHRTTRRN